MRIVIAPDSFKGSLSALEVAEALARGLQEHSPHLDLTLLPMADGGEGTLEVLSHHGMELVDVSVRDHQGRSITAQIATRGDLVVIESAQACRFEHNQTPELALQASSTGVGMLIEHALERGAKDIILTLGGTASTDGGHGMLSYLGARILQRDGTPVKPGGGGLRDIASVDFSGLDQRLKNVTLRVVTDVLAPLLGPEGAARQFAPQKGADLPACELLESGLHRFAELVDFAGAATPGAGAGGGLGFGAIAGLRATAQQGASTVATIVGLQRLEGHFDWVITGEGSCDSQSFGGKVVGFIADWASARGIPVGVVCGQNQLHGVEEDLLGAHGIVWVESLVALEPDPTIAIREASVLLQRVGKSIASRLLPIP